MLQAILISGGLVGVISVALLGLETGNAAWTMLISPSQRMRSVIKLLVVTAAAALIWSGLWLLPLPTMEPSAHGLAAVGFGVGAFATFGSRYFNRPR